MDTKDKPITEIEKQILDELEEEILELKKQGRLYKFETAMENAMEKFKNALNERTEQVIDKTNEVDVKKKLSRMWATNKSNEL